MVKRQPAWKTICGGFGIVVDVGFGGGVHVAAGNRAAHDHDFFHQRNDRRVFQQGEGDVGERADGDEGDLVRRLVNHLDDQVGTEARVGFAFAGGQLDVGEAVRAVPEFGGDQLLKQRMLGAAGDGNVAAIGEGGELQGVFQALLRGHIAGDDGESADIQFRRIQGEKNGERVVGAGVGIDDYFLGSCGWIRGGGRARISVRASDGSAGESDDAEHESDGCSECRVAQGCISRE